MLLLGMRFMRLFMRLYIRLLLRLLTLLTRSRVATNHKKPPGWTIQPGGFANSGFQGVRRSGRSS